MERAEFLITGHKHSFIEFRPLPGRRNPGRFAPESESIRPT